MKTISFSALDRLNPAYVNEIFSLCLMASMAVGRNSRAEGTSSTSMRSASVWLSFIAEPTA